MLRTVGDVSIGENEPAGERALLGQGRRQAAFQRFEWEGIGFARVHGERSVFLQVQILFGPDVGVVQTGAGTSDVKVHLQRTVSARVPDRVVQQRRAFGVAVNGKAVGLAAAVLIGETDRQIIIAFQNCALSQRNPKRDLVGQRKGQRGAVR